VIVGIEQEMMSDKRIMVSIRIRTSTLFIR